MTPLVTPPDPRATDPLGVPEQSRFHRVRIVSPDGIAVLTRIYLDDIELRGVTLARYEIGIPDKWSGQVTLRLYADVEIEGEPAIVKEWRNARPSLRARLLGWLRRR